MKTFLLAGGALLLAAAAPAFAQDSTAPADPAAATAPMADPAAAPAPAPADAGTAPSTTSGYQAPAASSSFTGPRAEIFFGYDRVGTRLRTATVDGTDTQRNHRNGFTGGGLLGYDLPIGDRLVAGIFGSYSLSTARSCAEGGGCLKAGREIEGGARIGAKLMDDKALVYVKGAYVNGRIIDSALDAASNRDGWRAGAGVEYALNAHTYIKAEYDYTRFNRFNLAPDASLRFDRNQVLGGFGVRF
ncbi:outer membrane protein [Sphingomonas morindae]|uniref:Outer membrane beta-barrel protein n=1 Tax=Sphingomonas morindae TaxID=1541170 RepID=A0ABY4X491_9SPHN|nr:outer membrane beta-barrel protein [Sphingomonas morindae]USI71703.1 outer membrane beta-barrel protein [Sphingomonas morindae]